MLSCPRPSFRRLPPWFRHTLVLVAWSYAPKFVTKGSLERHEDGVPMKTSGRCFSWLSRTRQTPLSCTSGEYLSAILPRSWHLRHFWRGSRPNRVTCTPCHEFGLEAAIGSETAFQPAVRIGPACRGRHCAKVGRNSVAFNSPAPGMNSGFEA